MSNKFILFIFLLNLPFIFLRTIRNPLLLQVSARPWLLSLSSKLGTNITSFNQIPESVYEELQSMKVDYLWVMGVWKVGQFGINHDRTKQSLLDEYKSYLPDFTLEDAIGCPYAVVEYDCNPELCPNGNDDLLSLKSKLNSHNIKLMLDFVPNHSAFDSPWMSEDINLYIRERPDQVHDSSLYFDNGVAFGGGVWTDVAQLNYFNPKTREIMLERIIKVASLSDSMRCDTAIMVANDYFESTWKKELEYWNYTRPSTEFWSMAIEEVKKLYPNTVFFAEVFENYLGDMLSQGFDYVYDKDLLIHLSKGNVDVVRGYVYSTQEIGETMGRFIENHDDNRAASFFKNSTTITNAAALITYTSPGMKFLFQDFQYGFKNRLDVHLRRSYAEPISEETVNFYNKLLPIITSDILKYGTFSLARIYGDDSFKFIAWKWNDPETHEKLLIIVNFSDGQSNCNIVIDDVESQGNVKMNELLYEMQITRDAEQLKTDGLFVILESYSGMVFSYI